MAALQFAGEGVHRSLLYLVPATVVVLVAGLLQPRSQWLLALFPSAVTSAAVFVGLVAYPIPVWIAIALYVALAALAWDPGWRWVAAGRLRLPAASVAGVLGGVSLVLSLWPLLPVPPATGVPGIHYPREELEGLDDPRLIREPGEPPLAFAVRVNEALHAGLYSHDYAVTPGESWLVWLVSRPEWGSELRNIGSPALILRRRGGLCHQRAIAFAEILCAQGVAAYALGLNGHVVAVVEHEGRSVLFDPDYGVAGAPYPGSSREALGRDLRARYLERLLRDLPAAEAEALATRVAAIGASLEDNRPVYIKGVREAGTTQERLLALQTLGSLLLCAWGVGVVITTRRRTPQAPVDA